MTILNVLLLVIFVIAALLLILIVLIQNEEGNSMGGIFAGGGSSAFGARSGNILTRATSILGALFLVLAFSLALLNRTPSASGVEEAARESASGETSSEWWLQNQENEGESQTEAPK